MQSGKDPEAFAKRLCDLGKYHARNIHSWEGGSCDFHSEKRCTCGNCEEDEVECEGREYATKNHNVLIRFRSKDLHLPSTRLALYMH